MKIRTLMRIRKWLSIIGILSMLSGLVVTIPMASAYDESSAAFGKTEVKDACEREIIDCTRENPEFTKTMNRAEGFVMFARGTGLESESAKSPFPDLTDDWYKAAAHTAYTLGWTIGDNGKFNPNGDFTRTQIAIVAARVLGLEGDPEVDLKGYSDVAQIPAWEGAKEAMAAVVKAKLMGQGTGGKLFPVQKVDKLTGIVILDRLVAFAEEEGIDPVEVYAAKVSTEDVPVTAEDVLAGMEAGQNFVGGEWVDVEEVVVVGEEEEEEEDVGEEEEEEEEDVGEEEEGEPEVPAEPVPPVAAGALAVALASDSPTASIVPDGTAFNTLAKFNFTASAAGAVKLKGLTVTKGGYVADTGVKLSVWSGGKRYGSVVQVSSDHKASIDFSGDPINIPAGTTVAVGIGANLVSTINSGTIVLSLAAKEAVTSDSSEVAGTFPVAAANFQITDGSASVAAATFDVRSLRTTTASVDIGQKGYEITRFELAETSSKEDLKFKSLTLFNNGSTADGDLKNIVLKDQDGATVATAATTTGKYVSFVFASTVTIPLGTTRVYSVEVDVANGATRTAQFAVQNDFDIGLEGASTGATILTATKTGGTDTSFPIGDAAAAAAGYNHLTVNEGNITISKDNSSPSGDVTKGGTNLTLAKFKVQAVGEDVELQKVVLDLSSATDRTGATNTTGYMDCQYTSATVVASTCDLTGSVKLVTSTGKTLLTLNADTQVLWNATNGASATATYADLSAFHVIPAGTTETLSVIANLASAANLGSGETVRADITKLYYYKKSSLKYADSGAATSNTLTVTTSSLTVSSNTAYGNQTVVSGTAGVKLASFVLRAGSAEGVNVTSVGVQVDQSGMTTGNTGVSNLKVMKVVTATDGTTTEAQVGTTQSTVADATTVSFSVSGLNIPASSQVVMNIYGDMSSSISTATLTTTIPATGVAGSAMVSTTSTSAPATALALQVITGSTGGTLRVVNAGSNPVSNIYVAGTAGNVLGVYQLSASLAEDIYLKEVKVRNNLDANDIAIGTLALYSTATQGGVETALGTASLIGDDTLPGYSTWTFSGSGRPKVPSNGSLYLTVKGDVTSSQQRAVSGLTPQIALASVKAEGVNQVTPLFVATSTATASTAILPSAAAGGAGAVNDTGCDINNAGTAYTASSTTLVIDNGGAGTCDGTTIVTGMTIRVGAGTEYMLVTAATATSLTVTRAVGYTTGTTNSTPANDEVIYYGHPIANASNNVFVAYAAGGTSFTAAAANFVVGQVVQLDTEDMYVKAIVVGASTVNQGIIYVDRAVNNTTLAAHNTASGAVNEYTAVQGNMMTVVNTKPTFSATTDSPAGAVLQSNSSYQLAKFKVEAAANTADQAVNRVTLTAIDVRIDKSSATVSSVTLYPADEDLGSNTVTGAWLSQNSVRFTMTSLTSDKNLVDEGQSRTYILRANIAGIAATSSIRTSITSLGTAGATGLGGTALGAGNTAPDIQWSDGTTPLYWVKQDTTQLYLNSAMLTYSATSGQGTLDTTGPSISSFVFGTATGSSSDNILGTGDTIVITYGEAIDPTSINASLVPGGSAVTPDNAATCDASITASSVVTITGIGSTDISTNDGTAAAYVNTCALSAAGTVLTVTISSTSVLSPFNVAETAVTDVAGFTTTVTDVTGNTALDSAVNWSGTL